MFKEVCRLIANRTGLTIGSTLQVGHRTQNAPERSNLVSESAGGDANPYCRDMADINIQIISRAKTYFQAREDAWLIFEAIHGTGGWNLPNEAGSGPDYLAMTIDALTVPQYIGPDENGLHEFSTNYIVRLEQASCGSP